MRNIQLCEKPGSLPKTVLTSMSLLLSSSSFSCALANVAGAPLPVHSGVASWEHGSSTYSGTFNGPPASRHHGQTLLQTNFAGANPAALSNSFTVAQSTLGLPNQTYQLDLSSATANIALGTQLFHGAADLTINVGGQSVTIRPGAVVTAGEYVAVKEMLANGQQTIVLAANGTADGGTFSLNQVVTSKMTELTVPQSVTAIDYLTGSKSLSINGDLINYGSIYGVSKSSTTTSGTISAKDITNERGGLISTQLPASVAATTGGLTSATDLTLSASGSLTNSGTIAGSGSLTLASGSGSITNNSGATITSPGNVNLSSGNGNLANSGLIASTAANINVASPSNANSININAAGGTHQAQDGAINIRDASYNGAGNINLAGGDYLSQNLNLYSGTGAITGNVGQVTGKLNSAADDAHFIADTSDLVIGNNTIKGDPTYVNTGDITIAGNLTASEDLTILAGGNVNASGAPFSISTSNSSTGANGVAPPTDVTIIAGVAVAAGTPTAPTIPGSPISAGSTATIDFSQTTAGGNINLSGVSINTSSTLPVDTTNTGNQLNGGNVLLAAYQGTSIGTTGAVTVGTINTSSSSGNGGNVTIIAGQAPAPPQATITVDSITTGGGGNVAAGVGGRVAFYNQQPGASSGTQVTWNSDGSVASGSIVPTGPVIANGGVQANEIVTGGSTVGSPGTGAYGGRLIANVGGWQSGVINTAGTLLGGSITMNGTTGIGIGGGITTGTPTTEGADVTISAGSFSTGNITTGGYNVYVVSTIFNGNITTGTINTALGSQTGDVTLDSGGALTVTASAGSTTAITGRNVMLAGMEPG